MADNKKETGKDEDGENEESKKSGISKTTKIIILAVVLTIVLLGGSVGTTIYIMSGDKTVKTKTGDKADTVAKVKEATDDTDETAVEPAVADEDRGPLIYQSLDPKFVVSFNDQSRARFMQFSVDVVTHNSDVKDQINLHMPAIRSSILMLIGDQKVESVETRAGKEKLLQDITDNVNATLLKMEGRKAIKGGVEAAYFDSFVIQ